MPLAFDAIRYPGPEAQAAVPALIEIVTAPFTPIRLGRDSDEDCEDARLGIAILSDMEPVVAKAYLTELKSMLACYAN
jgi:hypothetical protein